MKTLRGTALYCGIGKSIDEMKAHLEQAASVGINAVFSSLQLPESNRDELLRDFPRMAQIAHSHGMIVDTDISPRSAKLFGLDLHDFAAFKQMGVDYARLDYGYSDEALVEATHNTLGITVELNAAHATEAWLQKVIALGINREHIHFCHTYYPMRYTGLRLEEFGAINDLLHRYGFRVGGFLASQTHQRPACAVGLPTVERHREMNAFTAAQEAILYGLDNLFFGDDFASPEELKLIMDVDPEVVTFRMRPFVEGELTQWLLGRRLYQTQHGLDNIIRSSFGELAYHGDTDFTFSCQRHRGDVTVCKSTLWRYAGEIEIVRQDLPRDMSIGLIGRIIDEDLPLLESFRSAKQFRFIRDDQ